MPLHVLKKKNRDINSVCTHSDIVHAHNSTTVIHILLEVFFLKKNKQSNNIKHQNQQTAGRNPQ